MSEIKSSAKKLSQLAKKYGYEIKHTHALELISQLQENTNRHVALKKEKNHSFDFSLTNKPKALDLPFFKAYVIEVSLRDESLDFVVVSKLGEVFELMGEAGWEIESLKVLTKEDLNQKLSFGPTEENPEADEIQKTILELILEKNKKTGDSHFSLFYDEDEYYSKLPSSNGKN